MPLEVYAYRPTEDPLVPENKKWEKRKTVYPGEEIQIPSLETNGRLKMMRVQVKPDDSMSTIHVIFPTEIIIRDRNSEIPSQVKFDDAETENLPEVIHKGESHEIFSSFPVPTGGGKFALQTARGKLVQR